VIEGAQSRETAARTAVEVGTVGLGLAIGGPVIATAVKPALELIAVREQRGLDNIEQVVESVTESTGLSPDELSAWARSDEARLDVGEAIVAALADLEARHVRVLHAIDREDLPRRLDGLDHVPGVAIQSQLGASFPNLAHGILPIMAALERHKIVEETMAYRTDETLPTDSRSSPSV
jgi:hypothetical protein